MVWASPREVLSPAGLVSASVTAVNDGLMVSSFLESIAVFTPGSVLQHGRWAALPGFVDIVGMVGDKIFVEMVNGVLRGGQLGVRACRLLIWWGLARVLLELR